MKKQISKRILDRQLAMNPSKKDLRTVTGGGTPQERRDYPVYEVYEGTFFGQGT